MFLAFDDDYVISPEERAGYYTLVDQTFDPFAEELDVLLGIGRRFLPAGGDFNDADLSLLRRLCLRDEHPTDDEFYEACADLKRWIQTRTAGRDYERAVHRLLLSTTSREEFLELESERRGFYGIGSVEARRVAASAIRDEASRLAERRAQPLPASIATLRTDGTSEDDDFFAALNAFNLMLQQRIKRGVFVSYRREERACHAWQLLTSRLIRHFSNVDGGGVFIDVEELAPGDVFAHHIREALQNSSHLVAVIGPEWVRRRKELKNEKDWVRIELELALEEGVQIIPVLIDGVTRIPTDLPGSLSLLAQRHYQILNHSTSEDFNEDLTRLLQSINPEVEADNLDWDIIWAWGQSEVKRGAFAPAMILMLGALTLTMLLLLTLTGKQYIRGHVGECDPGLPTSQPCDDGRFGPCLECSIHGELLTRTRGECDPTQPTSQPCTYDKVGPCLSCSAEGRLVAQFAARCGDGILQTAAGEECDDGNRYEGDLCSGRCKHNVALLNKGNRSMTQVGYSSQDIEDGLPYIDHPRFRHLRDISEAASSRCKKKCDGIGEEDKESCFMICENAATAESLIRMAHPGHRATVPGPLWMMKTPVTQSAYRAFECDTGTGHLKDIKFSDKALRRGLSALVQRVRHDALRRNPRLCAHQLRDNNEVASVRIDRAAAYCAWAGGRLPMESEYEYAARNQHQKTVFPWGNDPLTKSWREDQSCRIGALFNFRDPSSEKPYAERPELSMACEPPAKVTVQDQTGSCTTVGGICGLVGSTHEFVVPGPVRWEAMPNPCFGEPRDRHGCWMSTQKPKVIRPMHLGHHTDSHLKSCRDHAYNPYGLALGWVEDCAILEAGGLLALEKRHRYPTSEAEPALIVKGGSSGNTHQVLYQPQARFLLGPAPTPDSKVRPEKRRAMSGSFASFRCVFDDRARPMSVDRL